MFSVGEQDVTPDTLTLPPSGVSRPWSQDQSWYVNPGTLLSELGVPVVSKLLTQTAIPRNSVLKKNLIFMCLYLFKGQGKREKKRDLSSTDEMA